ncbi:hypothetical protein OH77DRAFT_1425968 [Trametes cingulata]|nr:hypothetical protein OH77DRAFT_1425968 [Trametes cingulata]
MGILKLKRSAFLMILTFMTLSVLAWALPVPEEDVVSPLICFHRKAREPRRELLVVGCSWRPERGIPAKMVSHLCLQEPASDTSVSCKEFVSDYEETVAPEQSRHRQ